MSSGLFSGGLATERSWERLPGESRQAYRAWATYRDMTGGRSYTAVAEQLDVSNTIIGRWGSRWRWQRRLDAFLKYQEEQRLAVEAEAIREMNSRQADVAMQIQSKIREHLEVLDPNSLSVDSVVKLLAIAFQTERLARGLGGPGEARKSSTRTEATLPEPREVGGMLGERLAALKSIDRDLLRQLSMKHLRLLKLGAEAQTIEKKVLPPAKE